MAECANPNQLENFVYRGFDKASVQGNTLVLTSDDNVVYYTLADGTACRIKNNNEEDPIERTNQPERD